MKIILVSPYFFPHKGGVEQFNFELGKRLAKFHKIVILSSKLNGERNNEHISALEIVRISHFNLLGETLPIPKKWWHIKRIIREIKPDLIITSTRFFPISFWTAFYARKMKIKHIHIEHGSSFVTSNNKLRTAVAKIYDLIFGGYVIRSADMVHGISKACAKFAKKLGAKKTGLLYNSVDCKFFDGNKKKHSKIVITYIGRLIYAKGVHDLINAFKKLDNKNIVLNIAGSGNFEAGLKESAKTDQRISFLGQINRDGIKELLSRTDVFVNPSYSEGLPTSVLEAGAMKCAVIATDVGGTSEIIDNKTGALIISKNVKGLIIQLERLIRNPSIRRRFSANLHKHINNNFCFDKTAEKFIKDINV